MNISLAISVLFAVVFTITGPLLQFFPVFLSKAGLTPYYISWAMGFVALSKIFSTFFTAFFIDRNPRPHLFLAVASGFTAFVWGMIYCLEIQGVWLVTLTLVYSLFWSSAVPLSEGFSLRACRIKPEINYGRMRLFGSAAFILSGFLCSYFIDIYGIQSYPLYIIFWCFVTIIWTLCMPNIYKLERVKNLELPSRNIEVIKSLLGNKDYLLIIFGAGIMHAGHALLFQTAAIDWISSGYAGKHVSLFFAVGVIAEIIIFHFAHHLEKNFSIAGFFTIAATASVIRWVGMAHNPSFEMIIFLQSLHGATFGILHLGCIRYFRQNLDDGTLSAAQLIFGGVLWGVVMIPASFIAGYLYEIYYTNTYYVMAFLGVVGTIIIFLANNLIENPKKILNKSINHPIK